MTTKTIECVECGASVPYGRLSCPSCGSLLASVSGSRKPAAQIIETIEPAAAVEPGPDDDLALSLAVDADAVEPSAAVTIEPLFAVEPDADDADPATAPVDEPVAAVLVARPYTRSSADDGPGILASLPSAYRPSTLSISAAAAGGPSWSAVAGSAPIGTYAASGDAGAVDASSKETVDVARFAEISGWFVVVGASMSILGFLLPWSVTVIGSRSYGGYFGSWGLASPTHVLVLLGLLAVLALGVLHSPVPDWIRTGVLGLAVGGVLIGLVWPYVVGPLGADVGVLVTALGGISLVIGGAVGTWATRHVEPEPPV
jgi:hypothetical protein